MKPLRFPGGSIGHLAVHGTVNDLAVQGAVPTWLSAAFVIEEGFPVDELRAIVADMVDAAAAAGVAIVTGDTKVVGRGAADGLFISTAGVGVIPEGRTLGPDKVAAIRAAFDDSSIIVEHRHYRGGKSPDNSGFPTGPSRTGWRPPDGCSRSDYQVAE